MFIRKANKEDLSALCHLYTLFYQYHAQLQPNAYTAAVASEDYPLSILENRNENLFVADHDDEIIGFIHVKVETTPDYFSIIPHRFGLVVDLFVRSDYRGQQIGTALLDAAKIWAKERELDYLELTVLSNNPTSISFYEKKGFQTVSHTMRWE